MNTPEIIVFVLLMLLAVVMFGIPVIVFLPLAYTCKLIRRVFRW